MTKDPYIDKNQDIADLLINRLKKGYKVGDGVYTQRVDEVLAAQPHFASWTTTDLLGILTKLEDLPKDAWVTWSTLDFDGFEMTDEATLRKEMETINIFSD